jgi:hypothetical protein
LTRVQDAGAHAVVEEMSIGTMALRPKLPTGLSLVALAMTSSVSVSISRPSQHDLWVTAPLFELAQGTVETHQPTR